MTSAISLTSSTKRHGGLVPVRYDSCAVNFRELSVAEGQSLRDDKTLGCLLIIIGLKAEFSNQIAHCEPISRSIFELTELTYTCLSEIYEDKQPMTGHDMLGVYTKYLKWYESAFGALHEGGACTPSIIFLQ